jgi:hypothetical protein
MVKFNENCLLVFNNSTWMKVFLAFGFNGKVILGPREGKSWTTLAFAEAIPHQEIARSIT